MKYEDLINSHREKVFQYDIAYQQLILPIENPLKDIDSIIEFVRRWNRRVPVGKNKDKIKKVVISLREKFETLQHCNLEDFLFTPSNIEIVGKIFDTLSATVLKSTGTTKLMHGMNPNLFVMWDRGIYMHYGFYPNSAGYINFMERMQREIQGILKDYNKQEIIRDTRVSLPKLIDEYNWLNFRTSRVS